MLIKQYKVQVIEPMLKQSLEHGNMPSCWLISANDLQSAWRKFTRQYFGTLCPNPADYDIAFHSILKEA